MRLRFVLASFLALFFIASHLSTLISYASHASVHGCAPLSPPSMEGSSIPAPATPGKLLINEALSLPGSRWNCSELQNTYSITNDSWIELYNPQNQAYNLYAAHATFEIGSSTKPFYLPLGSVIAPHGFLVLFPSTFSGTLISSNIRLLIQGVTIDQINFPSLSIDQSYARITDGSISWHITNTPTIDASNNTSQPGLSVSPTVSSSNSSNKNSTNQRYATSTPVPISGTPAVWSSLQFPTPASIETPVAKPPVAYPSSSLTPVNDGWDTPHRILITTLVIMLALMLFWCWRLFTNS
ncbi:MAG TPA: hypothetical protein VE843_04165 [Ktedonobacteraceae bacterium]|nr:hypothetical protein [Ktedonobacteraceae bacterium]